MSASVGTHEPREKLSAHTQEMHRALASLMEELEAIDWYAQRVDASEDAELQAILRHNMEEEMEHAAMTLEWIRRNHPTFGDILREHLFREGPITAGHENGGDEEAEPDAGRGGDSLPLGSLRARDEETVRE